MIFPVVFHKSLMQKEKFEGKSTTDKLPEHTPMMQQY
jgi:hypothetical protein